MASHLFHLVAPDVWAAAVATGEYRPPSLASEGFVHFSFAEQVAGTANLRYGDATDLVVVEIASDAVTHEVRVEDSYGSGTSFPHVYGPIDPSWAAAVHPLERVDGQWSFSGGSGLASSDH